MTVRFTQGNWDRFKNGKTTTIRMHPIKPGWHDAVSGSRFKPKKLGEVFIRDFYVPKCVRELNEADAKNDGFNSLAELLLELGRLNKDITVGSIVLIHGVVKRIK